MNQIWLIELYHKITKVTYKAYTEMINILMTKLARFTVTVH